MLFWHGYSNVPEAVYMQHLMGIDGVIVDFVQEITEAVADMVKPTKNIGEEEGLTEEGVEKVEVNKSKPQFSQLELSFLYKLIPQLLLL
jgi:glycerophosphodiester phosphodiesterase